MVLPAELTPYGRMCNIEVVRERKTLKKLEREFRESTSQNESGSGRERFVNIQLSANSKRALAEHIPHDMFNIIRESPTGLSRSLIQVPNVYIDCAESLTHSEERIFHDHQARLQKAHPQLR